MRMMKSHRRWAAPIVALVAVAAMVGLLPHFGFTSGSAPIWTERTSAQTAQIQAPDWVRLSKEAKPAVVNISSKLNAESAMPPQFKGQPDDRSMDEFFKRFFDEAPPQRRPVRAGGSGFIGNANGFIITNNHKGQMEVQSTPGQGTCFTLRLPLSGTAVNSQELNQLSR